MSKKKNIVWPQYKGHFQKKIKDGSIDGVPLNTIWKQCKKDTLAWLKSKPWWKEMVASSKVEKQEIIDEFKQLTKEQKEAIERTKVL